MTHTPTPWKVANKYSNELWITIESIPYDAPIVASFSSKTMNLSVEQANVNASFIVRAVNAHDELLVALKDLLDAGPLVKLDVKKRDHYSWMVREAGARKAIAKAEGK